MEKLNPPIKRYLSGKLPSHSAGASLHTNFSDLERDALVFILFRAGLMEETGKPTREAVTAGLIDQCERKALWKLEAVAAKLEELGHPVTRKAVNQTIKEDDGTPRWVNLGTVGTYFSATANAVGKWLDELELRDDEGMGNDEAFSRGLAMVSEMNAGEKKTRKITMWNLYPTQRVLVEAGHELDFDYEKNLKGKGKHSDVTVTTVDDRVDQFVTEFTALFKDAATRTAAVALVRKTPTMIVKRGEEKLGKPGFITGGTYLKYVKR